MTTIGRSSDTAGNNSSALLTPGARRACISCAKLKEKCIPHELPHVTNDCKRCYRLGKTCVAPEPRKRRKLADKRPSNTVQETAIYPSPASSDTPVFCRPVYPVAPRASEDQRPVSATLSGLGTSRKAALFRTFLDELDPFYPFLALEGDLRDHAVCEEKLPFTFATCLAAALHREMTIQKAVLRDILTHISESMFVYGQKSLDILQGVNVLLAFYALHHQRNAQLMNLVFLGKALLTDLGLSKPRVPTPSFALAKDMNTMMHGSGEDDNAHGLPGIRMLMSCWYAQAQLSIAFRVLEYPVWTDQHEERLQKLRVESVLPSDIKLIKTIRVYQTISRYLATDGIRPSRTFPVSAYTRCFHDDLTRFRNSLPFELISDPLLRSLIATAEIALYDVCVPKDTSPDTAALTPASNVETLSALHALLISVGSWYEAFLALKTDAVPCLTFLHMSQASHATDILAKLSFLQLEGWDLTYVRTQHSLSAMLEKMMDKFEDVFLSERTRFPDLEMGRFAVYVMKLRNCKKWYEERLTAEAKEKQQVPPVDKSDYSPSVNSTFQIPGGLPDWEFGLWPELGDISTWSQEVGFGAR